MKYADLALWLFLATLLVSACTTAIGVQVASRNTAPSASQTLTVFAAASLTGAFKELGSQFEASNPEVKVVFNFAGSQQSAQQLVQGAPADVFASANETQMKAVIKNGRVAASQSKVFANNRLVIILPKDNPAHVTAIQELVKPGLKLVLADQAVPVGQYALQFLNQASQDQAFGAGFKDNVLENVVSYEENVKSVLSKVLLGEADAGIVYTSDITETNAGELTRIEIPDSLNVTANYYIAPISDSSQSELAEAFVAYVLSPTGQGVLAKHGLMPVIK